LIIIFLLYKQSENFVTNTEAINNIVSMYNDGTLTATNITTTDTVNSKNINANVMQVIGPDGALWTNNWPIYANRIYGANSNDLHIYSGKKTTIHTGPNDNNTLEVGEIDGSRKPYVEINGNLTTRMPVIRADTVQWDDAHNNKSLTDWASTTGCGGLMSKTMPAGTTKSFLLFYNNGSSWAQTTITLIESSGAYIWTLTSYTGLTSSGGGTRSTPLGLSGKFNV
jgi:hypothetical protein